MLPNLIVIGANSAGTTSLYHYLHRHPEITMTKRKELQFFSPRNWKRGSPWYAAQFEGMSTAVRGEASPQYTYFPGVRRVPERMHSVVPQAKLIYLVRDPIERAIAEYVDRYASRRSDLKFTDALTPFEGNSLVDRSRYHWQLEQFLPYYELDRILVVQTEALMRERRATLRSIFEFLNVDPDFYTRDFERRHGAKGQLRRVENAPRWVPRDPRPKATARIPWKVRARVLRTIQRPWATVVERPTLDPTLRAELAEYLKPDTDRLRQLTGMELSEWSV